MRRARSNNRSRCRRREHSGSGVNNVVRCGRTCKAEGCGDDGQRYGGGGTHATPELEEQRHEAGLGPPLAPHCRAARPSRAAHARRAAPPRAAPVPRRAAFNNAARGPASLPSLVVCQLSSVTRECPF